MEAFLRSLLKSKVAQPPRFKVTKLPEIRPLRPSEAKNWNCKNLLTLKPDFQPLCKASVAWIEEGPFLQLEAEEASEAVFAKLRPPSSRQCIGEQKKVGYSIKSRPGNAWGAQTLACAKFARALLLLLKAANFFALVCSGGHGGGAARLLE